MLVAAKAALVARNGGIDAAISALDVKIGNIVSATFTAKKALYDAAIVAFDRKADYYATAKAAITAMEGLVTAEATS